MRVSLDGWNRSETERCQLVKQALLLLQLRKPVAFDGEQVLDQVEALQVLSRNTTHVTLSHKVIGLLERIQINPDVVIDQQCIAQAVVLAGLPHALLHTQLIDHQYAPKRALLMWECIGAIGIGGQRMLRCRLRLDRPRRLGNSKCRRQSDLFVASTGLKRATGIEANTQLRVCLTHLPSRTGCRPDTWPHQFHT